MLSTKGHVWLVRLAWFVVAVSALALLLANLGNTRDASAEWRYTVAILNPVLLTTLVVPLFVLYFRKSSGKPSPLAPVILLGLGIICILIPLYMPNYRTCAWQTQYLLSFLWGAACLCLGIFCFMLAKGKALRVWCMCIAGSILLSLGVGEFFLLATSQTGDGLQNSSSLAKASGLSPSQNTLATSYFMEGACGPAPAATGVPWAYEEKLQKFNSVIYDARYDINERGHRQLPGANLEAPNDLLLFGCSYTFGSSLDTEQTWAWQLATQLGKNWFVENYAQNGYGVSQMLCQLEHNLVLPPKGQKRFALFLALEHHIRRNEFFQSSPHYRPGANGTVYRDGKPAFAWINSLDKTLNGSQLAAVISGVATNVILKKHPEYLDVYLGMLNASSRLLKEKYSTELIVLLWPGFEYIQTQLEKMGIRVLLAKNAFSNWDEDNGASYLVHPLYDQHPNAQAAMALTTFLASWLRQQVQD